MSLAELLPRSMDPMAVFEKSPIELLGQDHDAARLKYLSRLSQEKIWVPRDHRAPTNQTVIVFDWDDTLLCTKWLAHASCHWQTTWFGTPKMPPAVEKILRGIERQVAALLAQAKKLGRVFIITNAQEGWVELSAKQWAPGLIPAIEGVPVISARSRFEARYPTDVKMWKIQAFSELKKQLLGDMVTNLISVGDAEYEMRAVRALGQEFEQATVKTIKLRDQPTPAQLLKQLQLVCRTLQTITETGRDLKMGFERKTAAT